MKALELQAVGRLALVAHPVPEPGPGEVLLKIAACGVCGSDLPRIFEKGTYHFPTVCGHEFAGTVAAIGPDVSRYRVGDRTAVFPLLWCGHCAACETGHYVQCSHYDYFGSRRDGGFEEYLAVPERNLIAVPDGVTLTEAAMTEPAAVALHAVNRLAPAPGVTGVVFGAGPIGLLAAQWLRLVGVSPVILFDVVPEKLEIARQLGFADVFSSLDTDPAAAVTERTAGRGAAVVIEAAGRAETLTAAIAVTARGGRLALLGNHTRPVTLPPELISQAMRREIALLGVWNSVYRCHDGGEWATALQSMAARRLELQRLISHRVTLDEATGILPKMYRRDGFFMKVMIHPQPDLQKA